MDLNKMQLIGNVTQDIELKQTPTGQNVCTVSVATNREWVDATGTKQSIPEFHTVVFWGKLAEICGQYVTKWKKIYVEWRLQTRTWEAQDGTKRYKTEIVGENLIMLDWGSVKQKEDVSEKTTAKATTVKKAVSKKEEEISIEDIPF